MRISITSGECLNGILKEKYPGEQFIPFNEAMDRGAYTAPLFSNAFVRERAAVHGVSEEEYRARMGGFMDVLSHAGGYDEILLRFGDEPFCRANRAAVVQALRDAGYRGSLLLLITDEQTGDVLRTETVP
ncbi:MAG: hypothetical protein CW338_08430 [Clostridiales bacterium]|nr:hypothetical protein [Clostridiales bacterium]